MRLSTRAIFILIFVTAIWGLTFPLIHLAVSDIAPSLFVFARVILASMGFLPFVWRRFRYTNRWLFLGSVFLAFVNVLTYLFQTQGLKTIPASRSAFITGISVVFVPLLSPLFRQGWPKTSEYLAAIVCVLGLYILTGANLHQLSIGDLWTLACAVCYALTVLILQIISKRTAENTLLSFYMVALGAWLPVFYLPSHGWQAFLDWRVILVLVFCAWIATTWVTYLMARYQKHVSVTKVAVIYALEPVFATFFSIIFNHFWLSKQTIVGGGLIVLSIILPNLMPSRR